MDYVIVASHCRYSEARARLLDSLWEQGVPRDRVVVVLNGSGRDSVHAHEDGYRVAEFTTNLFEYSAFLVPGLLGAGPDDAFMLLHDTSLACAGFGHKAAQAFARFRLEGVDILWCSSTGQCNLCVFGARAGEAAREMWGGLRELDKRHAIAMEHRADAAWSIKGAAGLAQVYVENASEPRGVAWPYSSRHERAVLYFPFLDLTKFYFDMDRWDRHPNAP